MKTLKALIILLCTAIANTAFSQSITISAVISLAKVDVKAAAGYMKDKKWKQAKTVKLTIAELSDAGGRYAHFTNCFFMEPEYKKKFKVDAGAGGNGVYRDVYSKGVDSIFVYYYNVDDKQYPVGILYKTNRRKLPMIITYLRHNKYTQTFSRDSVVVYEIRKSVENIAINKESATAVEYYIDRCGKYAGQIRRTK